MRGADLQRDGLNERPERHTGKSLWIVWDQLSNSRERNYFAIKKASSDYPEEAFLFFFKFSSNFLHFFLVKKQQMLLFLIDELFNDI